MPPEAVDRWLTGPLSSMEHSEEVEELGLITRHLYNSIRPLILSELQSQPCGGRVLDPKWCKAQRLFFDGLWRTQNKRRIELGITGDLTLGGRTKYGLHSRDEGEVTVSVRFARECLYLWPTCPAVHLPEKFFFKFAGDEASVRRMEDPEVVVGLVEWMTGGGEADDPREIYRYDGNAVLNFPEWLLWSARVGGTGAQPFNNVWTSLSKPVAYVPIEYCGSPLKWKAISEANFDRWPWMCSSASDGLSATMVARSRKNMRVCSVCLSPPAPPMTLLLTCPCRGALYCSKLCQKRDFAVHKRGAEHKAYSKPAVTQKSQQVVSPSFGEGNNGRRGCNVAPQSGLFAKKDTLTPLANSAPNADPEVVGAQKGYFNASGNFRSPDPQPKVNIPGLGGYG